MAALIGGAFYIATDMIRMIRVFSPLLVRGTLLFGDPDTAPNAVTVGDEINFLLRSLFWLVVFAVLLGLFGAAIGVTMSRRGVAVPVGLATQQYNLEQGAGANLAAEGVQLGPAEADSGAFGEVVDDVSPGRVDDAGAS